MKIKPSNKTVNNIIVMECTEEPFVGIEFCYDNVRFGDETPDGDMQLHFEYDIVSGSIPLGKTKKFEQYLGDALISLLEQQLLNNELIYKGGIDNGTISE